MGFRRHLIGSLAAAALIAPSLVSADAPAAKWYDSVSLGGYAAAYYQQSLNMPVSAVEQSGYRQFDTTTNQFTLQDAEIHVAKTDTASNTNYYLSLVFGPHADGSTVAGNNAVLVNAAYAAQVFGPVTLTVGKMFTTVGYEVGNSAGNPNFGRSILFFEEPAWNVGAQVSYAMPMGFTLSGELVDGNTTAYVTNGAKDYQAELAYAGIKNLSLSGQWYQDNSTDGAGSPINLFNFIGTYTLSDSLSVAGEYLYKGETSSGKKAQGYDLYAIYNTPISNLSVTGRFGQWFTPDQWGTATVPTAVSFSGLLPASFLSGDYQTDDYTVTVKYVAGELTHILEYRALASNLYRYSTKESPTSASDFSQIDETITYAAEVSF